ncbi:hypothetical protein DLD77_08205 [Chitinophaga alhagiae]|uniref:ComEC family competence protein n=1 Tax=Chitinophaga alhagiae TaxID=2203219 RepID=A0ABM6WCM6_9BACT|nr:ComEC/Rec2 family competence protein [Chitinophaga alhagiae]AWO01680.1 hypothetical protein DLD77_08205 [Chitinophaga alhagiae]
MFVNLWKSAPFLRLIWPLIAGIITGLNLPVIPWPLLAVCCACWLAPAFLSITWRYRLRYLRGAAVAGTVFWLGMWLVYQQDVRHQASWYGHFAAAAGQADSADAAGNTLTLAVTLLESPVKKTASWKAEAHVDHVYGESPQPATGNILLYFKEEPPLHYGHRILLRTAVTPIRGTGNPGAFDYAGYCRYHNLFHQAFLQPGNWQKLPGNKGQRLEKWLIAMRNYCLNTLKTYIPRREEYGVAQALLIGYRGELDKDIVQAYSNTGVIHIIAISGLHLGLIYVTLLQLLRWLPSRRLTNIAKALLLMAVLWAFALLTGASASVLRSAVMFTTIAAGQFMINRHASTFNTLAAAAFLLLCYNPFFLLDAGFQLSFLAVAGILTCYKPVYDCWMVRNRWLDKVWQMTAVSLAAQVFTWPVCLLYFRQFPNYFLPANLVAVPLSTALLYGEILLVALPWLGGVSGVVLQWGIRIMNAAVQWIDGLPGAVTANIYISPAQMYCLYAFTVAVCVWWLLKRRVACLWALAALLGYTGLRAVRNLNIAAQQKLVVYNVPRKTLVEYVSGWHAVRFGDTLAASERYTAPAHLVMGVKTMSVSSAGLEAGGRSDAAGYPLNHNGHPAIVNPSVPPAFRTGTATTNHPGAAPAVTAPPVLLVCNGKRILLWKGRFLPAATPQRKIKLHYLVLSADAPQHIERFDDFFIYEKIIFDASCPAFLLRKWKSKCNKLPLRCFSVPDKGAFVVNL